MLTSPNWLVPASGLEVELKTLPISNIQGDAVKQLRLAVLETCLAPCRNPAFHSIILANDAILDVVHTFAFRVDTPLDYCLTREISSGWMPARHVS